MNSFCLLKTNIKRHLPTPFKNWLQEKRTKCSVPVYGLAESLPYDRFKKIKYPKRALLSYITIPFKLSPGDPRQRQFSNIGIARSIVHVLNELGYLVDVVEWTDVKFLPEKKYDLFIGHGGCNFEFIAYNLPSEVVKIYFSTGIYWRKFNQMEEERFCRLERERNVQLSYDRRINYNEESANQIADGIICLGNKLVKESYAQFPLVMNLNNAAFQNDRHEQVNKDFISGRNKFLFFSGSGNVHKGLDLLLEAFSQLADAHLYICQAISLDFYDIYQLEFKKLPNIHLIGPIPPRGRKFFDLINKCNYVIHPSCAEGQPGAVIECMHHGLIPIISCESNIDTDGYGITFGTCSVNEITRVVTNLLLKSPKWCEQMSEQTREIALTQYSEAAFQGNMKAAIKDIIANRQNNN